MSNNIIISFENGPKAEIQGEDKSIQYKVEFIDTTTEELVYRTEIVADQWCAANPKYYVPWRIKVYADDKEVLDYKLDLTETQVLVAFDSKSLGDNIAWLPMVEEFRKKHNCHVTVTTFWNSIFEDCFPELKFHKPDVELPFKPYAVYRVGAYDNDYQKNRNNWHLIPLQQISSDMLGIPKQEIRPSVKRSSQPRPLDKPYIAITEFSTWYAKQWNFPGGWQQLVDKIKAAGYAVMSISKEPSSLKGIVKRNNASIESTIRNIQHAEAFIGGSCGPTVLAWALGVPVLLVSGSTMPWSEFNECTRVINQNVCHGCFADLSHPVDRGNWKFCPRGRMFECTTSIPPDTVWGALQTMLTNRPPAKTTAEKVMFLTPHCSTGGGPQYLLRCVQELKGAGHEVLVIEYANISNDYTVQKKKLQAIVPFHTLNGNKAGLLTAEIANFNPGIIHLHEFGERFLDADSAAVVYKTDRTWKVVETPHSPGIGPKEKKYRPDGFAFVNGYHLDLFKDYGVPATVVEYTLPKQKRPDRAVALDRLGLDPTQRHILNVGLFCERKNQRQSFEIARQLPDIQFHFIGNMADNFKPYWQSLLADQPANVVLWYERSDCDAFYAAMDAFLFTSVGELFPLAVKEALSWSMPVFMRDLEVYCHAYDDEEGVTLITEDVDGSCEKIREMFPVEVSMSAGLRTVYQQAGARCA